MKKCSRCFELKDLDKFSKTGGTSTDGKHCYCKSCNSEYSKIRNSTPEAIEKRRLRLEKSRLVKNEQNRTYYKNRTNESKAKRADKQIELHLKKTYGITVTEYNKMLDEQEGKCFICQVHQNTMIKRLAVDHCHETGKVRALLCSACNTSLGLLEEDEKRINNMLNYLKLHKK